MADLNFNDQFSPLVKSGAKKQTIRKRRASPIKPGHKLNLWQGHRSQSEQLLLETTCKQVLPVRIVGAGFLNINGFGMRLGYYRKQMDEFAKADGFESWKQMYDWFNKKYELPMDFVLIKW